MYQPRLSVVNHQTHVAVIGCGYWGMNYVRVLSELPDSRVTVVCDERAGRLDEVARRFPDVQLTTSIEEALDDDAVEAAVICTQAATHREIAGRALELGKHVLVEKPFTVDVAEADELIELAEKVDRVLLTGHTFLYNGGVRSVKTLMDDGALGDLYYVYARRTNLGPFRADVNALWDLAPHDVAIFNYLLDDTPTWVSAVGARVLRNGREDVGFISLGYPGGLDRPHPRQLGGSPQGARVRRRRQRPPHRLQRPRRRRARPRLRQGRQGRPRRRADDLRRAPPADPRGRHHEPRRGGDGAAQAPVGHFLHCIRRGDRPQTTGRDGRDVVAVMRRSSSRWRTTARPVDRGARGHGWSRKLPVPFVDLAAQQRALEGELRRPFRSALSRTDWILGAEVDAFERGVRGVLRGAARRRRRLGHLRARAGAAGRGRRPGRRGHHRGQHVHRHGAAISHAGATPVLVDVDPGTHTLDPEQVAAAVTSRTRSDRPVHLYGHPADMDAIMAIADAARAVGRRGRLPGARRALPRTARRLARARGGVQLLPGEEPRGVRRRRRGRHDRPSARRRAPRAAQLRPAREVRPRREGATTGASTRSRRRSCGSSCATSTRGPACAAATPTCTARCSPTWT